MSDDEHISRAFKLAFLGDGGAFNENGKLMAGFLHQFCNEGVCNPPKDTVGRIDPIAHAMAIGRNQVWNKIYTLINVDFEKPKKGGNRERRSNTK